MENRVKAYRTLEGVTVRFSGIIETELTLQSLVLGSSWAQLLASTKNKRGGVVISYNRNPGSSNIQLDSRCQVLWLEICPFLLYYLRMRVNDNLEYILWHPSGRAGGGGFEAVPVGDD
jgi:hypothetical protein